MAQKPLMLKDYLELDSCSEAFWWTPIQLTGGTRVRSLLEAELSGGAADKGGWKLIRLRSKGALTRLSAFIKLLQSSAAFPAGESGPPRFLPRNFSKARIRSFWKKNGNEKKKDVVRLTSFDKETVPEILFSTTSSNSFVDGKESMPISPRTEKGIFAGGGEKSLRPSTGSQEPEEISGKVDMDCPFEEEKEQFSPVSVMDFPYRDEDEDDAVVEQPSLNSSSFDQSIINIERAKNQLLEKIRRFESLALDAVHLDYHFACTAAHPETTVHVETDEEEEGYEKDDKGETVVREMERSCGEWKRFQKEKEILIIDMTCGVVTWLMEELVDDLLTFVT